MPPKSRAPISARTQPSLISTIISEITNPDNRSVLKSVAMFGAAVVFLSSGASEMITTGL